MTPPLTTEVVTTILSAIHEVRSEVGEMRVSLASLHTCVENFKTKTDSDIRELKGGHRVAMGSLAEIKDQELAEVKAKHERWVGFVGKVAIGVVTAGIGWIAHVIAVGIH